VVVDTAGNLYIVEAFGNRIRKVSTTGTITTVAGPGSANGALGDGGPATGATLSNPMGVALDIAGNIYIADTGHDRVRKVSPEGTITTVAGTGISSIGAALGDGGQATAASVLSPTGVSADTAGNLYIADSGHYRIRKVSPAGTITTVAGNGSAAYSGDGGLATLAAIRPTST
jgi:sugar lactone lactonase YvrE